MYDEIEPTRTLWMLAYDDGFCHYLQPLYATSEEDAERQAEEWMSDLPRSWKRISLRAYPMGFTMRYERLPGKM